MRRVYRFFALLILWTTCVSVLAAEEGGQNTFEKYPQALGMYANMAEVVGLSYQRWFGRLGFEVAAGGTFDPDRDYSSDYFFYSILVGGSYQLIAQDLTDWFAGALSVTSFLGHTGRRSYEYDSTTDSSYVGAYRPIVSLGIGVGIEAVLFRHFSQTIQFMYIGKSLSELSVGFGVGYSFRYRF
jgi:hypothetical protein